MFMRSSCSGKPVKDRTSPPGELPSLGRFISIVRSSLQTEEFSVGLRVSDEACRS